MDGGSRKMNKLEEDFKFALAKAGEYMKRAKKTAEEIPLGGDNLFYTKLLSDPFWDDIRKRMNVEAEARADWDWSESDCVEDYWYSSGC